MSKNVSKAVGLTSHMMALPPVPYLVLAMVLMGSVFGLVAGLLYAAPLDNLIINGLLLLTIPALLSSIAIKAMLRKQPYRHIAAVTLVCGVIYSITYFTSLLLSSINPLWGQNALLIGSALVFVFWWVVSRYGFMLRYRSALFAAVQLLIHVVFLFTNGAFYVAIEPFLDVALKFYVSSFVLWGVALSFFFILDAPAKRNFNFNSMYGACCFISQWLYGTKEMEKAMQRFCCETTRTLVGVMGFKRKNDTVFFVTPYVHFGPLGNLGGSQFSHRLADEIDEKYGSKTFVFHGTATHDQNPVASSEIAKILHAVHTAIMEAEYKDARVSISLGQADECKVQALRINDYAMLGISRAPEVTEDISLGLGLAMTFHAEKYVDKAMVVDQHNAESYEVAWFEPGNPMCFGHFGAIKEALTKKSRKTNLKLGVASRHLESPLVGGGGLKVAVFSTSPEYVCILIDSNGVTPGFRDEIESEVKELGRSMGHEFVVGIFTTDTHEINVLQGLYNPLRNEGNIMSVIKEACREAVSDMQKATFFADRRWFDFNSLGAMRAIEIVTTTNSIAAAGKVLLPLMLIGGLLLLLTIVTNLP